MELTASCHMHDADLIVRQFRLHVQTGTFIESRERMEARPVELRRQKTWPSLLRIDRNIQCGLLGEVAKDAASYGLAEAIAPSLPMVAISNIARHPELSIGNVQICRAISCPNPACSSLVNILRLKLLL